MDPAEQVVPFRTHGKSQFRTGSNPVPVLGCVIKHSMACGVTERPLPEAVPCPVLPNRWTDAELTAVEAPTFQWVSGCLLPEVNPGRGNWCRIDGRSLRKTRATPFAMPVSHLYSRQRSGKRKQEAKGKKGCLMLISPAYAQSAGGGLNFASVVPLILIFVIMYFLLIRPQQKKVKEHKAMVAALRRGDQVVTQGGLVGKIARVKDDAEVEIELGEGIRVRALRNTISQVLSKADPGD